MRLCQNVNFGSASLGLSIMIHSLLLSLWGNCDIIATNSADLVPSLNKSLSSILLANGEWIITHPVRSSTSSRYPS